MQLFFLYFKIVVICWERLLNMVSKNSELVFVSKLVLCRAILLFAAFIER